MHQRISQTEVADRLGVLERQAHRSFQFCQHLPLEGSFELTRIHSRLLENAFGGKVAIRCVVLMQRMHGDAFWAGAGASGKGSAKGVVAFIGNSDPIQRTEHHWLACPEQDDAPGAQTEIPFVRHRIIGHVAANRRRGINVERGQPQDGLACLGNGVRFCSEQEGLRPKSNQGAEKKAGEHEREPRAARAVEERGNYGCACKASSAMQVVSTLAIPWGRPSGR